MLFDNHATQTGEASLDALWLKTQVITNNISNVETPGFKASSVRFEEVLKRASAQNGNSYGKTETERLAERERGRDGGLSTFRTTVTRHENSSVRIDGNNVVLEEEQAELWKTYAQYSYLLDRLGGHYRNITTAITNMRR